MVPAADVGEGRFNADVRLYQSRDLLQALSELSLILGPVGRYVGTAIDGFDHADRFEGLFAGRAELIVAAGRIHRFEDASCGLVPRLELLEVADGDCGLRFPKRARQLRAQCDGPPKG